ncbi:hypothetical protein J3459_010022 [Metarhizium acridum]|nr:hypothetical protein J3459_010022 [Metarhizium acridum]
MTAEHLISRACFSLCVFAIDVLFYPLAKLWVPGTCIGWSTFGRLSPHWHRQEFFLPNQPLLVFLISVLHSSFFFHILFIFNIAGVLDKGWIGPIMVQDVLF